MTKTVSSFQERKIVTAIDHAFSTLKNSILDGHMKPGMELPSESEMAQQLGVGKVSLRQALRLAQVQGLVEIQRGKRATVAHPSIAPVREMINLALHMIRRKRCV